MRTTRKKALSGVFGEQPGHRPSMAWGRGGKGVSRGPGGLGPLSPCQPCPEHPAWTGWPWSCTAVRAAPGYPKHLPLYLLIAPHLQNSRTT